MQLKFEHKDAIVAYTDSGNGLPVVLVHGFGEDAEVWQEQVNFLQNKCRLIVPQLPGSGPSAFKDDNLQGADTIAYYADVLYQLLRFIKVEECIMIGHSMGGYIALSFAESHSDMLKGLGLTHSTAFADSTEKKQTRQKGIEAMKTYGSYAFIKNTTPNVFAAKFKKEQPERVEALIEKGKMFSVKTLQRYYTAMMQRTDKTHVLKNLAAPVLFVMGTEDTAAPMQDVLKQTHLPKISFIHILENTGHMGMWESAPEMNNAIATFIQSFK